MIRFLRKAFKNLFFKLIKTDNLLKKPNNKTYLWVRSSAWFRAPDS